MTKDQALGFAYNDKERAIADLKKSLALYQAVLNKTKKVQDRIKQYKRLVKELKGTK